MDGETGGGLERRERPGSVALQDLLDSSAVRLRAGPLGCKWVLSLDPLGLFLEGLERNLQQKKS
jgi:hypothetical protein